MRTVVKFWSFWRFTYYGNCLVEYWGGVISER